MFLCTGVVAAQRCQKLRGSQGNIAICVAEACNHRVSSSSSSSSSTTTSTSTSTTKTSTCVAEARHHRLRQPRRHAQIGEEVHLALVRAVRSRGDLLLRHAQRPVRIYIRVNISISELNCVGYESPQAANLSGL